MEINRDFEEFFESLNNNDVRYLVIGGYAYAIYAEPRYTKDLDIWISADLENGKHIIQALEEFGFKEMKLDPYDFTEPEQIIQLGYPPLRIDLVTSIDGVQFEQSWPERLNAYYGSQKIFVIGKEDLIKNKEATGRDQDALDANKLRNI